MLNTEPSNPLRPNAINNAKPATEGGNTIGRSSSSSNHDLCLIFQCANMYASGVPNIAAIMVVIELETRLNLSAFKACSENASLKKFELIERKTSATNGSAKIASRIVLGMMMIPLIMRTTEEVVRLVPPGYREAALADMATADRDSKRADEARNRARALAAKLKTQSSDSDYTWRAGVLVYKLDEGVPVYGIDQN